MTQCRKDEAFGVTHDYDKMSKTFSRFKKSQAKNKNIFSKKVA